MPTQTNIDSTPVDNNLKISSGGVLQADEDLYGSVIDAIWAEISGNLIKSTWPAKGSATLTEYGGKQLFTMTPPSASGVGNRRNISYTPNAYLQCDWPFPGAANWATWTAFIGLALWKEINDFVRIEYQSVGNNTHKVYVHKVLNGIETQIYSSAELGLLSYLGLKIKYRVDAGQNKFVFYYTFDTPPSQIWVEFAEVAVTHATYFPAGVALFPIHFARRTADAKPFGAQMTYLLQEAAYRYWKDSPTFLFKAPGQTPAFDAGAGSEWRLTGASSGKTEPGDGTVLFKAGTSDTPSGAITWDGTWYTEAQINTRAAAGTYDKRCIHVQVQLNSPTATAQPTCPSFTISGVTASLGADILMQVVP